MLTVYIWDRQRWMAIMAAVALIASPTLAQNSGEPSKSSSIDSKTEVRVEESETEARDAKAEDEKSITVVVDVSGDRTPAINAAIEKLEEQLKTSGIPVELQRKAIESLRSQMDKPSSQAQRGSKKAIGSSNTRSSSNDATDSKADSKASQDTEASKAEDGSNRKRVVEQRYELRLPFDRWTQTIPQAMSPAVMMPPALGPAQRKKLQETIGDALRESDVAPEVIEKALAKVDESLDEMASRANMDLWRGNAKPPYRIGIACEEKSIEDSQPGLKVETVFEDTPAAKAGLESGDRLISIDDQPIASHGDIVAAVQKAGEEGRSVRLVVGRQNDGKIREMVHELKPVQSAVAEFNVDSMPPFAHPGMPFPNHAFVLPQPTKDPLHLQEQIRNAIKEATEATRKADEENRKSLNPTSGASLENRNEKHIDALRNELTEMHKQLDEMKAMLQEIGKKP